MECGTPRPLRASDLHALLSPLQRQESVGCASNKPWRGYGLLEAQRWEGVMMQRRFFNEALFWLAAGLMCLPMLLAAIFVLPH